MTSHLAGRAAALGAGPERFAGLCPERVAVHQPSDAMQSDIAAGCTQFQMDTGGAVEAPVLLEHRLDLSGDHSVVRRPLPRRLLPLPPGGVTTAGHI